MCLLFCFFQKNGDCQRHEPPTLSLSRKNLFTPLLHSTITNCSVLRRKEMLHDWSSYQAYITHQISFMIGQILMFQFLSVNHQDISQILLWYSQKRLHQNDISRGIHNPSCLQS